MFPTPPSVGFYPLPYPPPRRNVPKWNFTESDLKKSEKSEKGFEKYVDMGLKAMQLVAMFHGVNTW
jgi:hypothetical protein